MNHLWRYEAKGKVSRTRVRFPPGPPKHSSLEAPAGAVSENRAVVLEECFDGPDKVSTGQIVLRRTARVETTR